MARPRLPRRGATVNDVVNGFAMCLETRDVLQRLAMLEFFSAEILRAKRTAISDDQLTAARVLVLDHLDRTMNAASRSDRELGSVFLPILRVQDDMRARVEVDESVEAVVASLRSMIEVARKRLRST